jgi:hypothetical protein
VVQDSFADVEQLERFIISSGCPRDHPASLALPRIKGNLHRMGNVYRSMDAGVEGLMNELDEFASREHMLKNELSAARTVNLKLNCAKKELGDQVYDLKSTAAKTDVEARRLKRDVEDLEAKREELERSRRELQEDRGKSGAEKLWLEDTIRKRDAEIERAAAENRRLQSLVEERDKQIEGLKSNNLGLQSLAQQREAQAEEANASNVRLQDLIRDKEARISSLTALPITPLSPMASTKPFQFLPSGLPTIQPVQTVPPRRGSPTPFIKQEVPDQEAPAQARAAAEQPDDPAQHLYQLGAGAADILGKLFHIDRPALCNDVLASFLMRLGAAPEASAINVTQASGYWSFQDPWTPDSTPPPTLHPTLEEQFAHLCLLFPFSSPGMATQSEDHPARFHLLTALLTALIKVDYSASPRAGLAFLQTMSALDKSHNHSHSHRQNHLQLTTATTTPKLTPRTALLSLLLCELCRTLEASFPDAPKRACGWELSAFLAGGGHTAMEVDREMERRLPNIARLAAALREGDRSVWGVRALRERLVGGCGAGFCWFSVQVRAGGDGMGGSGWEGVDGDGGDGGRKEMGLLHCGGGESSDFFLMIDFAERAFRVVACQLAGMPTNAAEPRKFDLTVARAAGDGQGEGEELFRLVAAPRDVATFWLGHVYGDD